MNTLETKIEWSPEARKDLREIYDYIKNDLNEPKIANSITLKIRERVEKLQFYYKIYPLISFENSKRTIRKIKLKRYIIFYTFYEEEQTIYILRILHERRNWSKILN